MQLSTDIESIIKNPAINKFVLDEMIKEGSHDGLSSLE